jgi:transposase-like protein
MSAARKYDQEFRQRAVRLYRERLQQHDDSKLAARLQVGVLLDLNPATLRNWVEDAERSEGVRSPAPSRVVESERYGRCGGRMRSYAVLMRSCAPRARFRSGGARPPTQVIVAYIDRYRGRHGIEPICAVLSAHGVPIAASTWRSHRGCVGGARRSASIDGYRCRPMSPPEPMGAPAEAGATVTALHSWTTQVTPAYGGRSTCTETPR